MKKLIETLLRKPLWIYVFFILVTVAVSLHRYLLGDDHINNYLIFKYSFYNLFSEEELYILHPDQYFDLYKYSPTFPVFMGVLYPLPDWLGLILWNLVNVLVLVSALLNLRMPGKFRLIACAFILFELITSTQNSQSNALMAGLMIWAFNFFERRNVVLAMLMIVLGFYIKVFALSAGLLFLFYPQRIRALIAGAGWMILLFFFPLVVTNFDALIGQYEGWLELLKNDPSHSLNYSIMTFVERTTGFHTSDKYYLIPGLLLLLLPLARIKDHGSYFFRLMFLSTLLIWVIIFNHKAESPTYVIAVTGAILWYFAGERKTWRTVLILFVLLLTSLSTTDLFPKMVREEFIRPYALKALPCILVWLAATFELLFWKVTRDPVAEDEE